MDKIKFGIIGCGNVSQTYLYTLNKNPNSEVVAVADPNLQKTEQKVAPFSKIKIYQDYLNLLDNEELDAVVISTPHYLHRSQAKVCAKKGLDILCEKPLATNLKDTEKILEDCKRIKLGVMLQRRFYPNSHSTKECIERGLLGKIQKVSLDFTCNKTPEFYDTWRGKKISGGGVLLSQALHRIDRLVYFFGKPTHVQGTIKTIRDYIEVEDYAKGEIYFENGIKVSLEANNTSGDPKTISIINIVGDKGEIRLLDDKTPIWDVNYQKPFEVDINNIPSDFRPPYYGPCHEMLIDDFVNAVKLNKSPLVTGKDALQAMKIVFGFYKSAENGQRKINLDNL